MITLFGAGPGFGLPEISPYVTKTEVQLQLAGLVYRKERARPQQSPKGQVPFISDDGHLVADSTFIRAYLEQKLQREKPDTQQEIVEEALGNWLSRRGFLEPKAS